MRLQNWFLPFGVLVSLAYAHAGENCSFSTLNGEAPLVIGHRGASGYRPEHTLASYRLAMELGADFVEPDLVMTRDGVLVARHEPNIIDTTDILQHPEFASRQTTKRVDGTQVNGFFVEDFTLAEIKTLRAVQSRSYRDQSFNGLYEIPTFREIIQLVLQYEKATGRAVGIYPETKHPSYFRANGLPLEQALIDTLVESGFVNPKRVFIQSFEVSNLRDIVKPLLAEKRLTLPLIQLFDEFALQPYDYVLAGRKETYGDLIQKDSLKSLVSNYASGIGVWKASFIKRAP
ncbi:MAG: glycerophosphodiester phosphodiesterase family protein, partial [Proteobacteria bacterium]|nr:glycerophosphodiester phosphodiesterase family protein [Pseudomonadota bacterium]